MSVKGAHLDSIFIEVPARKHAQHSFFFSCQISNHKQLFVDNDSSIKRGHGPRKAKTRTRQQHQNNGPEVASGRIWRSWRGTEASFPEKTFMKLMRNNWKIFFFGMLGNGEMPQMLVPTPADEDAGLRKESRFTSKIFSEVGQYDQIT